MYFIYGFFGALATLALLLIGAGLGWKAKTWFDQAPRHTAAPAHRPANPPEDDETAEKMRRQLEAEQRAFGDLMGYNISMAYGLHEAVKGE